MISFASVRRTEFSQTHRAGGFERGLPVNRWTGKKSDTSRIKLLRAGAHLIVTTRFPRTPPPRYAREPDFKDGASSRNLRLDLRHLRALKRSAAFASTANGWISPSITLPDSAPPPEFYRI